MSHYLFLLFFKVCLAFCCWWWAFFWQRTWVSLILDSSFLTADTIECLGLSKNTSWSHAQSTQAWHWHRDSKCSGWDCCTKLAVSKSSEKMAALGRLISQNVFIQSFFPLSTSSSWSVEMSSSTEVKEHLDRWLKFKDICITKSFI